MVALTELVAGATGEVAEEQEEEVVVEEQEEEVAEAPGEDATDNVLCDLTNHRFHLSS